MVSMGKDPAMLWYWGDWHSGTALFSRFLKGCYIDMLHAQFNNGRLSLEEIKTCLGSDFGPAWPTLQKKFKQDENGLFFNERLETEKEKRVKFSDSRRQNVGKRYDKSTLVDTSVLHMKVHMENENEIKNGIGNEFRDRGTGERGLVYDAQETVLSNQIEFERICMDCKKSKAEAGELLRDYHLHLTEKEQYPKTRKAVFAGFEKWIRNEKKFYGHGTKNNDTKKGTSAARRDAARNF